MKGRHLSQDDWHAGLRIVAGRDPVLGAGMADMRRTHYGELRIEVVDWIDEDARRQGLNARMRLRSGGETREALLCRTGVNDQEIEDTPWRTLWTEPLPGDDAVALAFVHAVAGHPGHRDVGLLWVAATGPDGVAYAHPLVERDEHRENGEHRGARTPGCMIATPAIAVRSAVAIAAGTVVAVRPGEAVVEDGRTVHLVGDPDVVMTGTTLAQATEAFPVARAPAGMAGWSNLAGRHAYDDAEERAQACNEASEALTLCWMDGGRKEVSCLAKTGIDFWRNDDPEDYARGTIPGPGLWMWRNVRYRAFTDHEGGWDGDMSGEWTVASEDDVLRMTGSLRAAASDIAHYTGDDEALHQYMAMAARALEHKAAPDVVPS